MMKSFGPLWVRVLVLSLYGSMACLAVETKVWEQSSQSDFNRGTAKALSVRSDGLISLAPKIVELDSTNVPYLWAITQDSKGTLYYGGGAPTGATTKVFALPRGGKAKTVAELTGLEIHALAVDKQDRVYAAVMPDAKVYRIGADAKAQLFFNPKCKYIWAMAFDASGNLFVATGDSGVIYRVTPDGKSSEFYQTGETHARSMIIGSNGDLLVGTEPDGLVLRVSAEGKGFVLFQTNKREVTALAEHDGAYYAASVGNRSGAATVSGPAPLLPPAATPAPANQAQGGGVRVTPGTPVAAPAVGSFSVAVAGGSDFYRIEKDGFAERLWHSPTELVYSAAFSADGKPVLGTGNKGYIYRVDSDQMSTQLLSVAPTQVTGFYSGLQGTLYAVTGNVGSVYAIGPAHEESGTFESEVLDADNFSYWGRVHLTPAMADSKVTVETRSGNVNRAQSNWSGWAKVDMKQGVGRVDSPAARFLQYRVMIKAGASEAGPELSTINIGYLPRNIAPKVRELEIAPVNYRQSPTSMSLERSVEPSGSPTSLTLPALGQRRSPAGPSVESSSGATLQYAKGFVTARWSAEDANSDPLSFSVDIKKKDEQTWRPLKDKTLDRFYSFDSSAFEDGDYVLKVTATDAPGNVTGQAMSSSMESDTLTIDNTPPEIRDAAVSGSGSGHEIAFSARDARSWVSKAEYSINGGDWKLLMPVDRVTDAMTLSYRITCGNNQIVAVRVFDDNDNVVVKQFKVQ